MAYAGYELRALSRVEVDVTISLPGSSSNRRLGTEGRAPHSVPAPSWYVFYESPFVLATRPIRLCPAPVNHVISWGWVLLIPDVPSDVSNVGVTATVGLRSTMNDLFPSAGTTTVRATTSYANGGD